jgi:hypothetical protein
VTFLRSYVTGTNDAILIEVGRTTAVSGGGRQQPEGALIHISGTPPRGPRRATTDSGSELVDKPGLAAKFP